MQTDCTEQLGGQREADREMGCRIPEFMEKVCVHLSVQGQMLEPQNPLDSFMPEDDNKHF